MSIAPGAAVWQIACVHLFDEGIGPELVALGDYSSIQVLSSPHTTLTLCNVIALIKSLPLLSNLKTGHVKLGGLAQGVSKADLPEYVHSTYAPLGKRFRSWSFKSHGISEVAEAAIVVLLLALACPNFDRAVIDDLSEAWRLEKSLEIISEPGFCQYAPRLRRLLPSK
ncbi:hypothetical protein IWW57_001121 [Coemansia sp. S610]|nr:hypothetical protein IWW57_001121 [Coemansia sp. S610]